MKALFYPAFDELVMAERPDPAPGPGEVLVRVAACGLCGSELETFRARSPRRTPPLVMGHEFCGTVEALGPGVAGVAKGQRVVSHSLVPCGACVRCRRGDTHLCADRQIFGMHRPGAFAEYVAVPAHALIEWPGDLPAEAACLAEPLANGVHMVHLTAWLRPRTVLVIGAGPIGLMAQQAYGAMAGAEVVVCDLSPDRRAVADRLGAAQAFDPREADPAVVMHERTGGEGADVVIDAVGTGLTKRQSIAAARPGGAAVWIGLHEDAVTLDTYPITLPERHVLGTYAATQPELAEAVALMATGRVDVTSWPTTFPLDAGVEAFHRMLAAEGAELKAVLVP
jgi:threonine dehydrogenase-like Zn-dependent dehydrogenase